MKCVRCQNDCKYRERSNGCCPKCQGKFAFEPRTGDMLSDMQFSNAVLRVSSQGQVRWGVEHLYYEICRRKKYGKITGLIVRLFGVDPQLVRVTPDQFNALWRRWLAVHSQPAGVIMRNPAAVKKQAAEPDIGDYSFDRAVLCDRARTVDVLLANNFHFENSCAVLSVEGYPSGAFETVRAMLKRNPKLVVFALHDATTSGCRLAYRLSTDPDWFAGQATVIDVGLRPVHAPPFSGLLRSASDRAVQAGSGIRAAEAAWLSKYELELAVIPPEQILKRLFKAMNRQYNPDESTADASSGDGGVVGGDGGVVGGYVEDDDAFSADADTSDGGGDSFG